jgi:nucleoside-diphosphate-sugar epimerase
MAKKIPTLLITGASGFIGKYLVEAVKEDFRIYALSRRAPKNPAFLEHPNIEWIEADLGDRTSIWEGLERLRGRGGVDYIIHLAGFYDFNYDENPEYHHTNVLGTEFLLEQARLLNVKRFIFASSVAACMFPRKDGPITESTPADATFAYARSKRKGEEMVRASSKYFPCSVARFGAVFSDWCEYGPLYVFINTWLTRNWKSRILGGKGKTAITYIHINAIIDVLLTIIHRSERLPAYDVYIASPDRPVNHNELFSQATRFFFGKSRAPFHMPRSIAYAGVLGMDFFGRFVGKRPFEKPWMMQYVDKELRIDASYTRKALAWQLPERYDIRRRLLFMIEHMKSYPFEWQKRNIKALKEIPAAPNFRIYEALDLLRDQIVRKVLAYLHSEEHKQEFPRYQGLDPAIHKKDVITVYQFLSVSVRTRDRMSMLAYARQIAAVRSRNGFAFEEVRAAILTIGRIIQEELVQHPSLRGMEHELYDEIAFTFQLMVDEIEGAYEQLEKKRKPVTA